MKTAVAVVLVAVMATLVPEAYCVDHVVGGSSGWAQSVDYTTWANGETFAVGDKLVFTYGGSHSVDQVSQSDYTNCNSGSAIKSYNGGSTTITLSTAGSMYFICPTVGHCDGGMKLAITVGASSTTPSTSPSTPGTSPSTPTTSTSPPPPPKSGSIGMSGYSNTLLAGASILAATVVGLMC
ncbi:hypothetical protein MLD38_038536 [Melastoma candidum]|uniref:Uncharacterized protein n=1 Tax=Melastoma candidum TaxID=119954 RepID=A0ACB9KZV8_9MYRT|nr:hypothetical protein MLD38_038536 [Melastoma candidum]